VETTFTSSSQFQSFQSFNRYAPFKAFQANAGSKRSKVPVVPIVPLHSRNQKPGNVKTLAEFPHRPGDEQEERIRWNQLALFGLWLRRFPERLHGGGDEKR